MDARALCNAALEAIVGQRLGLSSVFCAPHNHDKLSTKQRVICQDWERFQPILRRCAASWRRAGRTIAGRR
ncbi:protein of unknown function [Burkholderia multivorans]